MTTHRGWARARAIHDGSITPPPGTDGPYYIYVIANNEPPNEGYQSYRVASQDLTGNSIGNSGALQDYQDKVYEGTLTNNNIGQTPIDITYKEAALTVDSVTLSDPHPSAGETVTVTWHVTNTGNRATRVSQWLDGLYLSNGTSISTGDYALVQNQVGAQVTSMTDADGNPVYLQPGQSYTNSAVVTIPTSISGNYNIIVKASTDLTIDGQNGSDIRTGLAGLTQYDPTGMGAVQAFKNEGTNVYSVALPVTAVPPPFLQVGAIAVTPGATDGTGDSGTPTAITVTAGQTFTVNYTVDNNGGATPSDQGNWNDLIYLSQDPNTLDLDRDTYLGFATHTGGLSADGSYSNSMTFTAPQSLSGTYYVWVVTNPANAHSVGNPAVIETAADQVQNMASSAPVLIETPPPADLVVQSVDAPTSAEVGDSISLSYNIVNTSSNAATGNWTDAIYLSQSTTWSPSAVLVGKVTQSGPLAAGAQYPGILNTTLPPLSEGSWHVIVRPDIYDNVGEDSNPNLATAAGNAINVTVPPLTLGTPVSTTLTTGQDLVYKVVVPAGQTLRVNLDSSATSGNNEVFVKYGAIPTASNYDAAYTQALAPSQQALIPSTQAGTYYVLIQSDDSPQDTPVTVSANLVPLSITSITPTSGGAATAANQYVTMDIYGAAFAAGAQVELSRPGVFQIQPQSWQVLDATHIQATFDLSNVPYGQYDVEVINPDGTTVTATYQYLVTQAIQPDVTVGIGGPSQLNPGDNATYTLSLENLSNVNTPYVQFNVGATNLGIPDASYGTSGDDLLNVLGVPYLTFASNVVGQPPGAPVDDGGNDQQYGASPTESPTAGTTLPNIQWSSLPALQNVSGFNLTPGFALNLAGSGTIDQTFSVQTYPALTAWLARDFPALRAALYALHPSWAAENLLADGPQDLDKIPNGQGLTQQYFSINPDTGNNLTDDEELALSYTFNVFATATPLTRAQFVTEQTAYADQMRSAILKDPNAPIALQVLASNQSQWEQGWLAALEAGGVLLPDGEAPPVSSEPEVLSLNAMLGTGILLQNGNSSYKTEASILGFFNQVQQWYGNTPGVTAPVAPLDTIETREDDATGAYATSPVADAPNASTFDNPYSTAATQFLDLNVFVGGRSQAEYLQRIGLLNAQFQPVGPGALDLLQYIQEATTPTSAAATPVSVQGPTVTPNPQGASYVPAGQALPYTISFKNTGSEPEGQIRIVTQLDPSLNLASVRLGDIQIGDLNIQIPADRADFQGTFDYTTSDGFILSVTASVDPTEHSITWLLQAINPDTGAVMNSPTLGLLAGDPSDPDAPPATGYVSYTVQASAAAVTGATINTSATVAFDNDPPVTSQAVSYTLDAAPPKSSVTATPSGTDALGNPTFNVNWNATDDASGVKYVTVYVAEDGGNFMIWQDQVAGASGHAVFTGQAGHTYQFLTSATDYAGNNEAASITNAVLPSDGTAQQVAAGLGTTPTVGATTAQTPAAPTVRTYVSNTIFTQAQQALPGQVSSTNPGDLQTVLAPMSLQSFASGYTEGAADIGAMAMVQLADGTVLASAGAYGNEVFAYPKAGGQSTVPLFTLNAPVLSMAVDSLGQLWVTTGNQLLQIDPNTGAIVQTVNGPGNEPLTQALAIDPSTGLIYVSSGNGIEQYNPNATSPSTAWTHFSNTPVTSLAFGPDGRLWGVESTGSIVGNAEVNPTSAIVSFPMSTDSTGDVLGQPQLEYTLAGTVDSITFGQSGTPLAGLLFASTSLPQQAIPQGGAAAPHDSVVWMVSLATRQALQLATGGTQGEGMVATSDGRLLVAQTNSIDQIALATPPHVMASSVPDGAMVTLPLGSLSVTFDQEMWLGAEGNDPSDPGSVLNPANFTLVSTSTGSEITLNPTSITWDAASKTAILTLPALAAGGWQLQVSNKLLGADQINLANSYVSSFTAAIDFSSQVKLTYDNTRVNHATGQVSYDVSITNIGSEDIHGPLILMLDPGEYFDGQVQNGAQDGDSQFWTLDLTSALDAQGGVLAAGATLANQTVTVGPSAALTAATGSGQLIKFNMGSGIYAVPYDDVAPTISVVNDNNSNGGTGADQNNDVDLADTPTGTVKNADGTSTITTNDGQGDVTSKTYSATGVLQSDIWLKADGSSGTDTYNADGSSSSTIDYADGSSRSSHMDAHGNTAFTDYDLSGSIADSGTTSVNADGSTTAVVKYADGTTQSATLNAQGDGGISYYDNSGTLSASGTISVNVAGLTTTAISNVDGTRSLETDDGQGDVRITRYNAAGTVIADAWQKSDGSSGSDTFNADGSSSGTVLNADGTSGSYVNDGKGTLVTLNYDAYGDFSGVTTKATTQNADGSSTVVINDGQGDITTTQKNAAGIATGDTWTKADGSSGSDTFNADGSSSGKRNNADGSYSTYVNNGQGSVVTTSFNAKGVETSQGTQATTINADGSTTSYSDDGLGNIATIYYNAAGSETGDVWAKADGSSGTDTYFADGSSEGSSRFANGTSTSYSNSGKGLLITTTFNAAGAAVNVITTTTTTNPDGSSSQVANDGMGDVATTQLDAYGDKLGDTWVKADGSSGTDTFNSDGSSTGTAHSADGSSSNYVDDGVGNVATILYNSTGTEIGDIWKKADGSSGSDTFNADGSSSGTMTRADDSFMTYVADKYGKQTFVQYAAGGTETASGTIVKNSNGTSTTLTTFADGTSTSQILDATGSGTVTYYSAAHAITSTATIVVNSDGSGSIMTSNADGTSSSETNDGQGNITTTVSNASGAATSDTWQKSDGSSGADTFNADGSSNGTAKNANGTSSSYVNDGISTVVTKFYSATGVQTNQSIAVTAVNADGSGTIVTTDSAGDVLTAQYDATEAETGDSWKKADGSSGSDILNGDGSSSGTTVNADGTSVGYTNDGQGNTTRTYYNAQGVETGETTVNADGSSSASTVHADGSETSWTQDGSGNIKLTQSDAAGEKTGDVWVGADGSVGYDSYAASGSSLGFTLNADDSADSALNDGAGNIVTVQYNAAGAQTNKTTGRITTNIDNSTTTVTTDVLGNVTTTNTDEDGTVTSDSWTKIDGTSGSDVYYVDGSSASTVTNADGSYSVTSNDGKGDSTTTDYSVAGVKLRVDWTQASGKTGGDHV